MDIGMENEQFDGEGFKETPLDGKEAAQVRHMFYVISRNWVAIDENTLKAMEDGGTVIQAIRIISAVIKVGGPVAVAGIAAGAYAKTQGWI